MARPKALLAWSSGKDSAWALHTLRAQGEIDVIGLLTTINRVARRASMHGVREELLEAQATAADLPLTKAFIPNPCSNEQYETVMAREMEKARAAGVTALVFGDLFLEDVRRYREERLASSGIRPVFPLWGRDTHSLAREMVRSGLRATVTCVDPAQLDASFAGRTFDDRFLHELPGGVDPCGERGEFHTLVHGGPMFERSIPVRPGKVVERDGFVFSDVRLCDD